MYKVYPSKELQESEFEQGSIVDLEAIQGKLNRNKTVEKKRKKGFLLDIVWRCLRKMKSWKDWMGKKNLFFSLVLSCLDKVWIFRIFRVVKKITGEKLTM